MNSKKFYWQRLLIPEKYEDYDYIVVVDSDIYISDNSPPLPINDIPVGKVACANERRIDWYKLSGDNKDYNDHINGGLIIYQPKYHGKLLTKLYDDNINNYQKYHQDDQSILSSFLIDNDLIYWLDQRYNRVWYFWKEILYPDFDLYDIALKKKLVANFVNLNYFCHFTSMVDIDLL